jgi:hypothetical protein
MEQGQEEQWREALARMHQGVQFLQLDRLVGAGMPRRAQRAIG